MDHQLVWSEAALDDVDEIAEYIHKDSPFYASAVVEKIKLSVRHLPRHPQLGRKVPEANNERLREVIIYDYRLVYEILPAHNTLVVLAVFHARRDVANALLERTEGQEK